MKPFPKYRGAGWLVSAHLKRPLTAFERLVADMIGQVERGIYHLSGRELKLSRWEGDRVHLVLFQDLSTYDGIDLAEYVGLCHLFAVRMDISARVAFSETDSQDFERTVHLTELQNGVCPAGWDGGPDLVEFDRAEPNDDFNPDEPEHPEDNPRTVTREYVRSATACLELMFSPRRHNTGQVHTNHLTLDQLAEHVRRLGEPIAPASEQASAAG